MWWKSQNVEPAPSAVNRERTGSPTPTKRGREGKLSTFTIRPRPTRPHASRIRAKRTQPAGPSRCSALTDDQRAANHFLSQVHQQQLWESQQLGRSVEFDRLISDIRALESIIGEQTAVQQRQAAELTRLRAEVQRWLGETESLSAQLRQRVKQHEATADQLRLARAQLDRESRREPSGQPATTQEIDPFDMRTVSNPTTLKKAG